MAAAPRVSLAMPVYNGAWYVGEAITSALAQDFEDFELIITDNASDDATPDICNSFARLDRRIRFVRNPKNLGAAPNYNLGFELARGDYLKWCAHDDLLSTNYVSACLAALEKDPGAALAFGRTVCIDPDGRQIDGQDMDAMDAILDPSPARRFHTAITRSGTCFPIFGLFRRSILARTTLHRPYYGSDRALIAETALLGRCLLVPAATFYNREHPTRSIRMVDHGARSRWQSTSAGRGSAMEHVGLARHLTEIAMRHGDVVSPLAAATQVARFALRPMQVGRIALDLARYASPNAAARLKRIVTSPAREGLGASKS